MSISRARPAVYSRRLIIPLFLLFSLFSGACAWSLLSWPASPIAPSATVGPTATPQPAVPLTFRVTLPASLAPGERLMLSVVDEVTGLALNPTNYPMQAQDERHYVVTIPCALNSVLKYRYLRLGKLPVVEDTSLEKPVRYRLYLALAPAEIEDVVASWSDTPFSGNTGRITGQVTDGASGAPLVNILVTAGGVQTLTDSQGKFVLEGLPPGTHNLVAYALDEAFSPFQQGAVVAAGLRTPVTLTLTSRPLVNVMFVVSVPANTVRNAPVRLAGNLLQLGNTFSDLNGGMSTLAGRMPVLSPLPDGRYVLRLSLPLGADIRYKYTLGDGFWNAEHRFSGEFVLRQLIVSEDHPVVMDTVETWQAGSSAPIVFRASVPANTPSTDVVSIQFNPYGWTEPIPMWPMGNNRWVYQLFGPLNMLGQFEYRYCRNEQCGVADDIATPAGQPGRVAATSLTAQDLQDEIHGWVWGQATTANLSLTSSVQSRNPGFPVGVEFQANYHPSWRSYFPQALLDVQGMGANLLVLTPSWTVQHISPFVFAPTPGTDPFWSDMAQMVSLTEALNLGLALFPQPRLSLDMASWWSASPLDAGWWDAWFERYRSFAVYHADLASQSKASMLILGGEWVVPALPDSGLAGARSSALPGDADGRWRDILSEVRRHFSGRIYWALPFDGEAMISPPFLTEVDGIYLLWYAPLGDSPLPSIESMAERSAVLLEEKVLPLVQQVRKPLILAVAYPSIMGAARAAPAWQTFNQPTTDHPDYVVNLQAQSDIYQAILQSLNDRAWISGFVSRGYYPPVALRDESASVHGKPATEVLHYWYPRLRGVAR